MREGHQVIVFAAPGHEDTRGLVCGEVCAEAAPGLAGRRQHPGGPGGPGPVGGLPGLGSGGNGPSVDPDTLPPDLRDMLNKK